MAAGRRASAKALEQPPAPDVGAPVLDPTDERDGRLSAASLPKGRQQRSADLTKATAHISTLLLEADLP